MYGRSIPTLSNKIRTLKLHNPVFTSRFFWCTDNKCYHRCSLYALCVGPLSGEEDPGCLLPRSATLIATANRVALVITTDWQRARATNTRPQICVNKTLDLCPATIPIRYLNAYDLIKAQQGADGTTTTWWIRYVVLKLTVVTERACESPVPPLMGV